MRDDQLKCDCCKKRFSVLIHAAFTWEYNEYGLEQVFCVSCSKKKLQDARGLTNREALIPQHPPKIRQKTVFVKDHQPPVGQLPCHVSSDHRSFQ